MVMRVLFISLFCILFLSSTAFSQEKTILKSRDEKVSYGIGLDIGNKLKDQFEILDHDLVIKGMKDAFSKADPLISDEEFQEAFSELQKELVAKQEKLRSAQAEKNKKEGEEFLASNKNKPGVKTLASGLQYKVIKSGKGETPKLTDTATVHYRGRLLDGSEFDSSYKRNSTADFPVSGVVKGMSEALQLMPEGSKWILFIPPDLAYGSNGAGQLIEPNATLIFELELISIK